MTTHTISGQMRMDLLSIMTAAQQELEDVYYTNPADNKYAHHLSIVLNRRINELRDITR